MNDKEQNTHRNLILSAFTMIGDTLICVSGRRSSRDSSLWAAHGISTLVVGQ